MQVVSRTLRQHLQIARSYPAAMLVTLATFLLVLYYGHVEHRLEHAAGYLIAVWLSAFVTDLTLNLNPRPAIGFPIKHSASGELAAILCCFLLGMIFLCIRFSAHWEELHAYRYLIAPLLLFVYPIVLALLFLLYFRYRPMELGVNVRYWYLAVLIHLIVGGITLTMAPDKSHWKNGLKEMGGLTGLLLTGVTCAALSEEFTRMLLQTRLVAALHNRGLGFVFASYLWAAAHIPSFSGGSPGGIRYELVHVWTIVPIGLLWGYLTHRTKSLLPAVLVHGLNLWGLQNL